MINQPHPLIVAHPFGHLHPAPGNVKYSRSCYFSRAAIVPTSCMVLCPSVKFSSRHVTYIIATGPPLPPRCISWSAFSCMRHISKPATILVPRIVFFPWQNFPRAKRYRLHQPPRRIRPGASSRLCFPLDSAHRHHHSSSPHQRS
jgi:hypothetical protein